MPVLLHEESQKVPLAVVASATKVPSTQASVAYEGVENYDIIYPNQAVDANTAPGSFVTWQSPMSSSMTDLSESFILIQGYFDVADGEGISYAGNVNPNATVTPFTAQAMFQDASVELNGVQVVQSQGIAQPICAVADIIKNESGAVRESERVTRGFLLDELLPQNEGMPGDVQNMPLVRQYYYCGKTSKVQPQPQDTVLPADRQVTFVYRMSDLGLRTMGGWLPPEVAIRIRVKTSPKEIFRFDLTDGVSSTTADLQWKFTKADLYLARRKLKAQAAIDLDTAWGLSSCKVPFERVQSNTTYIDANALSVNITNALAGPTPKAVMVFAVSQKSLLSDNADGLSRPFELHLRDNTFWQNARLTIGGGRYYPIQPYSSDISTIYPGNDWAYLYQLYKTVANKDPFLRDTSMIDIKPLCFQIGATKTAYDEVEETSLQFTAQISDIQQQGYAVVMVSFTDHIIEISKEGQVMVTTD